MLHETQGQWVFSWPNHHFSISLLLLSKQAENVQNRISQYKLTLLFS